jgi:hypothetical protein
MCVWQLPGFNCAYFAGFAFLTTPLTKYARFEKHASGTRMPEVSFRISLRSSIKKHRQEHLQTPFFALWASDLGFRKLIGPSFACVFRRVYKCFRLGRRPGPKTTTLSEIALFLSVGSTPGILLLKQTIRKRNFSPRPARTMFSALPMKHDEKHKLHKCTIKAERHTSFFVVFSILDFGPSRWDLDQPRHG